MEPVIRQPLPQISHAAPPETIARVLQRIPQGAGPASLYIHIPFCFHKCHYCDFYSLVDTQDRQEAFTQKLILELQALAPFASPLRTIFVGGGTPTLLAPGLWARLLTTLRTGFRFEPDLEFTVEANPETVTNEIASVLHEGGVNRVSMGAQSFHAGHLKTLERWHDPASVPRAVDILRRSGFRRLNVDLIFGIPGQSLADHAIDLQAALALNTEHVSCYDLTYEPATALTARRDAGQIEPIDEDLEAAMFTATRATLAQAGLPAYEISNFAKPGAECRHNLVYWRNGDWLAAGPSASGHIRGWRWKNVPHLGRYLEHEDPLPLVQDVEGPDPDRALIETLMMGLRLAEGIAQPRIEALARAAADDAWLGLQNRAGELQAAGVLETGHSCWRLTERGVMQADSVIAELAEAAGA